MNKFKTIPKQYLTVDLNKFLTDSILFMPIIQKKILSNFQIIIQAKWLTSQIETHTYMYKKITKKRKGFRVKSEAVKP